MKKSLAQILCYGIMAFAFEARAQSVSLKIKAVDGKDGKPLPSQRLVIFGGVAPDGPRFHDFHLEARTDKDGVAIVTLDFEKVKWIQVWIDKFTLCQAKPNLSSFEVHKIVTTGLSSPNNCGGQQQPQDSGTYTVFARSASIGDRFGR